MSLRKLPLWTVALLLSVATLGYGAVASNAAPKPATTVADAR